MKVVISALSSGGLPKTKHNVAGLKFKFNVDRKSSLLVVRIFEGDKQIVPKNRDSNQRNLIAALSMITDRPLSFPFENTGTPNDAFSIYIEEDESGTDVRKEFMFDYNNFVAGRHRYYKSGA